MRGKQKVEEEDKERVREERTMIGKKEKITHTLIKLEKEREREGGG